MAHSDRATEDADVIRIVRQPSDENDRIVFDHSRALRGRIRHGPMASRPFDFLDSRKCQRNPIVALAEELDECLRRIGDDDGQGRQWRGDHAGISAKVSEADGAVGTPTFRTITRYRCVPPVELRGQQIGAAALPKVVKIAVTGCDDLLVFKDKTELMISTKSGLCQIGGCHDRPFRSEQIHLGMQVLHAAHAAA
jgi:hypothetical protein